LESEGGGTRLVFRRRRVVWQVKMVEDIASAVVDVQLRHPGALHHQIKRREIAADEAQQLQRIVFDLGQRLAKALEAGVGWRTEVDV
jgi:hypothetical protein